MPHATTIARPSYSPPPDLDPLVYDLARPARAVGPGARVGEVAEILRASPYRAVAVVDTDTAIPSKNAAGNARLLGIITERALADAFLAAPTPEARAAVRSLPVGKLCETPVSAWATGFMRATEAAALLDRCGVETLPVVDPGPDGPRYLGMLSRGDLVEELVRPFRPPMMGGLATPVGVYLTTGAVSGGSGTAALIGSGLALWTAHVLASVATHPLQNWPALSHFGGVSDALPLIATMALYLLLVRLSPIAGFHAAEHQVVHAVERGEPLLIEAVRAMPRVHPRCGTNLVAGLSLFALTGAVANPLLARVSPSLADFGWLAGALVALSSWRPVGAWLQQYVTTRPATDHQISSGIRAAREVLERHGRRPGGVPRPYQRLWRLGFLQMMVGYALGCGVGYTILFALSRWSPPAAHALEGWLPLGDLF